MKITLIELHHYNRMRLSGIETFRWTPVEKIQIILGTNGSGKSSLVSMLPPHVAHHSDFAKDGYMITEFTHRGHQYRLESRFSPHQRHTLTRNGDEELYSGNTPLVLKEIIKQTFGFDSEVHDLMTGFEKFHQMSPGRRREWFTRLNEANYDYAIKVYSKAKESLRNSQGALKRAKERLAIETSKIIDESEKTRIEQSIADYTDAINILIENSTVVSKKQHDCSLKEKQDDIYSSIKSLFKIDTTRPLGADEDSIDEIRACYEEMQIEFIALDARIKENVRIFSENEALHRELLNGSANLSGSNEDQIQKMESEILQLKSRFWMDLEFLDIEEAKKELSEVIDYFVGELPLLPVSVNDRYHPNNRDAIEQRINNLTREQNELEYKRTISLAEIKHLEHQRDGSKVDCPRCNHKWAPGFNERNYAKHSGLVQSLSEAIKALDVKIETENTELADVKSVLAIYQKVKDLMSNRPYLRPFWQYLAKERTISQNPSSLPSVVNRLINDLDTWTEIKVLEAKIKSTIEAHEKLKEKNLSGIEDLEASLRSFSSFIETQTSKRNLLMDRCSAYKDFLGRYDQFMSLSKKIKEDQNDFDIQLEEEVKAIRQRLISSSIAEIQYKKQVSEKALNEALNQISVVNFIKEEIVQLTGEVERLGLIADALSPVDGLIAEGMSGFIKQFIREMNRLIKKIWTYRLEIMPCQLSSDGSIDLDYKFPLVSGSSSNMVVDINRGSTAMREIVDLVFKLVAMKYLDLSDYYITLDEFAASFDAEHRKSSVELIKTIMEEQNFSQLFMVSHDFSQYAAFSNYETCVLSEDNIVLPPMYNERVKIN